MSKDYLNEQAETLLKLAEDKGLKNNYLFTTTYNRYLIQIDLIHKLTEEFNKSKAIITKEYIKGRENQTANPLITKINQSIDSANKTANLIVNMLTKVKGLEQEKDININELEFFGDSKDVVKALGTEKQITSIRKLNKKELDKMAKKLLDEYKATHNDY